MGFADFFQRFCLEYRAGSRLADLEQLYQEYHYYLLSTYKHECAFITNTSSLAQQEIECRNIVAQSESDTRHSLSIVHSIYKQKIERQAFATQEENVREKISEQEDKVRARFAQLMTNKANSNANSERKTKLTQSDLINQSFPKKDSVSLEDWDIVSDAESGFNETLSKGFAR